MLRRLKDLEGFTVRASDGDIGSVENFLLDDERWAIRYLVVDTVEFLDGRQVLISPISFRQVEWPARRFQLALTMARIEQCPSTDMHLPVSRQHEEDFNLHYGYSSYWAYPDLWGMGPNPAMIAADREKVAAARSVALSEIRSYDSHLRSTKEVRGYHIEGSDGEVGHVEDFIVDDETWAIRYLILNTRNWWPGKQVLVSPDWLDRVSWSEAKVFVNLSREEIKHSPEFTEESFPTRDYEIKLHRHYNRQGYWVSDPVGKPYSR